MNESMLHAAFEAARALEPTDREVTAALRAQRRRRRWPALLAAGAILTAGGTAVAVEGSLLSNLGGGRPVTGDDNAPAWVNTKGTRVLAEADGEQLFVVQRGGQLEFGLGTSVGLSASVENWRERFADESLVLLGPGKRPGADGKRVLFGLTAREVVRVELTYEGGAPTSASSRAGGFALLADASRRAVALVGYDARGAVVTRKDASAIDLRVCPDVRGCPPGRMEPERRPLPSAP